MCLLFSRKRDLHFAWTTSISCETFSMFNIYLYFQISIIVTMHVPVWLLLKKKCTDSKTKLEALFFPYTKPGFCIYTLEFECKLQILHRLYLFYRYRRLLPWSLRKRCKLYRRSKWLYLYLYGWLRGQELFPRYETSFFFSVTSLWRVRLHMFGLVILRFLSKKF